MGLNFHRACLHAASRNKYNMVVAPWGTGAVKGTPQFLDMYEMGDKRLADSWDSGPQYASNGQPLIGGYDIIGKPMIFTRPIPNGLQAGEAEGYRLNKYDPTGANAQMDNDVVLFRYAQVLMMKAEALLRKGFANDAAALVTQVRMRSFTNPADAEITGAELAGETTYRYGRYVTNYGLDYAQIVEAISRDDDDYIAFKLTELNASKGVVISDMPAAIAQIKTELAGKTVSDYFIDDNVSDIQYGRMLDELGKEFVYEFSRRRDMIRFGVFTSKSWLTHVPNGNHRNIYPIPLNAMSTNSLLVQNPGY
jgi:starch-binding outer membrane protein, SusD/RagB family